MSDDQYNGTLGGEWPQDEELSQGTTTNMVIVGVLIGLIFVLCIVLCVVTLPPFLNWVRRKVPVSQKRIDQRYLTVEGWLISKKVNAHDDICEHIQRRYIVNTKGGQTKNEDKCCGKAATTAGVDDTVDSVNNKTDIESDGCGCSSLAEEDQECPICMEPFQVGEIVSWSANVDCHHVFHHACIKEWLLRRVGCPFCREIMLPVDRKPGKIKGPAMDALIQERSARAKTTYFCIREGLITVQRQARSSNTEIKTRTKSGLTIKALGAKRMIKRIRGRRQNNNADDAAMLEEVEAAVAAQITGDGEPPFAVNPNGVVFVPVEAGTAQENDAFRTSDDAEDPPPVIVDQDISTSSSASGVDADDEEGSNDIPDALENSADSETKEAAVDAPQDAQASAQADSCNAAHDSQPETQDEESGSGHLPQPPQTNQELCTTLRVPSGDCDSP